MVSLAGSRIAGFTISGDFGLLIGYGDDPDFASPPVASTRTTSRRRSWSACSA